jgi:hypothetical protein
MLVADKGEEVMFGGGEGKSSGWMMVRGLSNECGFTGNNSSCKRRED